jgi:peptide/nickel transport system ATP-binding protein
MANPVLEIEHLEISYKKDGCVKPIIQDVSLSLHMGETVALIGPSGCGKSLTAHAIVGLLDKEFEVTGGHIKFNGENMIHFNEKRWQNIRREEIALLIQHSLNGLDPIRTVRKQMMETIRQQKTSDSKKDSESYIYSLLNLVGFTEPELILSSYPFELSGGMRQRVLLTMMLSLKPKILIADEPTTALDVINQEKVLSLLKRLQHELELTILLISHDQQSIKRVADRVVQMGPGGIVNEST